MLLYNKRFNVVDMQSIKTIDKVHLQKEHKYFIIFHLDFGMQVKWDYDKIEDRDKDFEDVIKHLELNVGVTIIE